MRTQHPAGTFFSTQPEDPRDSIISDALHRWCGQDLSEQACVELLASTTVGRVTLSVGALPAILPVSYQYLANDILISIPDGPARRSAAHGNVIALEVDNGGYFTDVFWTVLVIGRATDHTTSRPGTHNLHLRPDIITGYRATTL